MTGLEKIIDKIERDSAVRCSDIIAAAQKHADEITAQAVSACEAIAAGSDETARHQAKEIIKMAHSGAAQKAKQIVLNARVDAVNETLASAANALRQMPAEEYFKSLSALAVKNAMQNQGEMLLSKNDLERLPPDFEIELNRVLRTKNMSIIIRGQPAAIEDGFILVYGDIEINCTFNALLDASRDELKEKICATIF